jgi:GFO/IDH/MocA oxidoreductase family protein
MGRKLNRRQALGRLGMLGAGALGLGGGFARAGTPTASDKLNIAVVGCGGQGAENLHQVAGENLVAFCDVDEKRAAEAFRKYPKVRRFRDYRKMLDAMHRQIDAVVVSIPDHMHAPVSLHAMELGKHVYCEKPLTWGIGEARRMAQVAREKRLATQMGTQGMAGDRSRKGIEVIRSGVLGRVTELHVWTDRPLKWWPQGVDRPKDTPPCGRAWTGTCGWAWHWPGRTTRPTARSSGGGGRTSAPGPSATWASTTPPCRSRPWNSARRRPRSYWKPPA